MISSHSIHHTREISWRYLMYMSKSARVCSSLRRIPIISIDGYTRCANLNPITSDHCRNNTLWRGRRRFTSKPVEKASRMDNQTAYGLLKLAKFDQSEIDFRFDQILQAGNLSQRGDSCVDSIHPVKNKTQLSLYDPQQLPAESFMRQSDIEAYLLQRYIHMEEEWGVNHGTFSKEDNLGVVYAENQKEHAQSKMARIQECARIDAASIFQLLSSNIQSTDDSTISLTKHQFYSSISNLATQIHYPTILPLAASMLLVGSSVGVISPIMPFLATSLDLSTSQYGIVVSSFALSKMFGNVPSAILVERHGRKPYLVHSLWLVGLGVAGLGLSSTWMELSICRMTIGLGVAALTTASTLTVTDVSTPLSRASSFSPVMSAFAAGTALGPAFGGLLCDEFGIRNTFLIVASSYGVVGAWNRVSLAETGNKGFWVEGTPKLPWHEDIDNSGDAKLNRTESEITTTVSRALQDTIDQWSSLINDRKVRPLVIMNGFYMMAISGTQMTLLPLLLTNGGPNSTATGIALTASAMGYCYAWMSAVAVVGNPAAGRFADKAGKQTAIIAGGLLTGAAMAAVPTLCSYGLMAADIVSLDPNDVNWPLLATTLGAWSLGSALLGTSHVAAISDAVNDLKRPQALALLRSGGDVGFLCGAISAGVTADLMGDVGLAMQLGSAVFMGATGWFGLQAVTLHRLEQNAKKKA